MKIFILKKISTKTMIHTYTHKYYIIKYQILYVCMILYSFENDMKYYLDPTQIQYIFHQNDDMMPGFPNASYFIIYLHT